MNRFRTYASFVRFSHSVFALPFALTGALLALHRLNDWTPRTIAGRFVWIVVAMVTARSAAMGFNRVADASHDALNPRTAMRELPRGAMTVFEARVFVIVSSVLFVVAAWMLGPVCLVLSPVALGIVFWYSLAKRFTTYTQLFLGLAMAVAPVGGWLAAGGRGGIEPWLLALAIGTWVGGFDVLYACQDLDFDRAYGLRSIPVHFGVPRSLAISRAMHVITVVCLAALGPIAHLGGIYLAGVVGVAVLLVYEQSLVSADDLSQVKRAFDLNGYVGLLYLAFTAVAIYVH
ncbi:MAG: 4-hydroxybenzoate octaprenyltransferase [Acidobacteria bacterium]|nr:4-hydroxybenzoate octaprenyltransferase [Acidobacteriota bacterium]